MSDIKLNFINNSNDKNNSKIVIFQKNENTSFGELAVAWRVIQNCGQGWNHPFTYPMTMTIAVSDSWGNFSQQQWASNGQKFSVQQDTSGDILKSAGASSAMNEVELVNELAIGAVNANIYKDGKLLATKTGIAPQQKAVFQFRPTLWIGVASEIEEGKVINSAILSEINTEIALFGLQSADIVLNGGGPGADSTPFRFTLQNIVYA